MTAQKILICMHDFFRGGTERVAIGLAASWVDAGRDVTILCGSDEGGLRDRLDVRVKVICLDPPVRRSVFSRIRLARRMGWHVAALKPDVIFLPGNYHALLSGGLGAVAAAPIALKISNPPMPHAVPFANVLFRHFTRAVDGFAAMNSGLARQLNAMLPQRAVVTLHDPVYLRSMAPRSRPAGGRNILWIGRLEPQKDPLLALETLHAMDASAQLTMLGDGALRTKVSQRIAALNLTERVRLLGHVPDIADYLAQADALLITSRYEGGPAVAVEALAAGVPLVGTDCSFLLRDLVTGPQAGRLIASRNPADLAAALEAVCAQPRALDVLRILAEPFEPKACAKAYLDWFDALTGMRHG